MLIDALYPYSILSLCSACFFVLFELLLFAQESLTFPFTFLFSLLSTMVPKSNLIVVRVPGAVLAAFTHVFGCVFGSLSVLILRRCWKIFYCVQNAIFLPVPLLSLLFSKKGNPHGRDFTLAITCFLVVRHIVTMTHISLAPTTLV